MQVPVLLTENRRKHILIVGVFSASIAADNVDEWLMRPDGKPRSDRELAIEVLVEIRKPLRTDGRSSALHTLSINDLLQSDNAAAIVVSTFLAALPRTTGRYWRRDKSAPGVSAEPSHASLQGRTQAPSTWREAF